MPVSFRSHVATLAAIVLISLTLAARSQGQSQPKNKPQAKRIQTRGLLILTDADCSLQVDGDSSTNQSVSAGTPVKLTISLGEHLLACTAGGATNSQEVIVAATDLPQRIVHVALAEKLAQLDQQKQLLERQQAEAERKANELADANLEKAKQIIENETKLSGKWSCVQDTALMPVDGRSYAYNGAVPGAGRVLEAYDRTIQIDFDGVSVDAKVASGLVKITSTGRLATQYELNGYTGVERGTLGMWQPACFNVSHNNCVASYSTVWHYDIDSVKEGDTEKIVLLLGSGKCAGQCPDDRTASSGRTITISFVKDHPGFKVDGAYCRSR